MILMRKIFIKYSKNKKRKIKKNWKKMKAKNNYF